MQPPQEGTYGEGLIAQVAFQVANRGVTTQQGIMDWYRRAYPNTDISNVIDAWREGERRGRAALAFGRLGATETLGSIMQRQLEYGERVPIRYNVWVPTTEENGRWVAVVVQARPGSTVALIEETAIVMAEEAAAAGDSGRRVIEESRPERRLVQMGGIYT